MKTFTYRGYDIVLLRTGRKGSGSYGYVIHCGDEGRIAQTRISSNSPLELALALMHAVYEDRRHREWWETTDMNPANKGKS